MLFVQYLYAGWSQSFTQLALDMQMHKVTCHTLLRTAITFNRTAIHRETLCLHSQYGLTHSSLLLNSEQC